MILWYKCWVKIVEYAGKSDQASHNTIKLYHVSTTHTHTCTYIAIHTPTHKTILHCSLPTLLYPVSLGDTRG